MSDSSVHRTSGFFPWIEIGEFRIQSYFVVISLVLCLCVLWIPKRAEQRNMPGRRALDLFLVAMAGGLLGSRLLHVLWEEPTYYLENPWRVLDVINGGFVWYGGAIGAGLSIFAWLKFERDRDWREWFDFFAPITAFGYAGGRFACLLTGCCYGRVCSWPPFVDDGTFRYLDQTFFRFPTQGFAVLWELAVGFFLLRYEKNRSGDRSKKSRQKTTVKPGHFFFMWLALHGLGRVIMEFLRDDPRGPSLGPMTISLGLSLGLLITGSLMVWKHRTSTAN